MRLEVEILTREIAVVIRRPSWWRRLIFGDAPREAFATRMPSIHGGWVWLYDASGRPVEPDVQFALERSVALAPRRISVR